MKNMNVSKQRRKFDAAITAAPDESHVRYLEALRAMFDAAVAQGQPQPASNFLPMYEEEFGL